MSLHIYAYMLQLEEGGMMDALLSSEDAAFSHRNKITSFIKTCGKSQAAKFELVLQGIRRMCFTALRIRYSGPLLKDELRGPKR